MKNLEELLSRFSQAELREGVERVKSIMNTPEGQQIRKKISSMDKAELMKKLNQLDASSSGSNVRNASSREILDRLNQFCDRE